MTTKPERFHCGNCGAEVTWKSLRDYCVPEPVFTREKVEGLVLALEFYADEGNYTHDQNGNHMATSYGDNRCGQIARTALEKFRGVSDV
jgi:hypothetical protein